MAIFYYLGGFFARIKAFRVKEKTRSFERVSYGS